MKEASKIIKLHNKIVWDTAAATTALIELESSVAASKIMHELVCYSRMAAQDESLDSDLCGAAWLFIANGMTNDRTERHRGALEKKDLDVQARVTTRISGLTLLLSPSVVNRMSQSAHAKILAALAESYDVLDTCTTEYLRAYLPEITKRTEISVSRLADDGVLRRPNYWFSDKIKYNLKWYRAGQPEVITGALHAIKAYRVGVRGRRSLRAMRATSEPTTTVVSGTHLIPTSEMEEGDLHEALPRGDSIMITTQSDGTIQELPIDSETMVGDCSAPRHGYKLLDFQDYDKQPLNISTLKRMLEVFAEAAISETPRSPDSARIKEAVEFDEANYCEDESKGNRDAESDVSDVPELVVILTDSESANERTKRYRAERSTLIIGHPGSGKTTFIKESNFYPAQIRDADDIVRDLGIIPKISDDIPWFETADAPTIMVKIVDGLTKYAIENTGITILSGYWMQNPGHAI